jgi:hypothetical protein
LGPQWKKAGKQEPIGRPRHGILVAIQVFPATEKEDKFQNVKLLNWYFIFT